MAHCLLGNCTTRCIRASALLLPLLASCQGPDTTPPPWVALPASLADGSTVTLIGVDSGLCLELGGSGYSDRDPAQLGECSESAKQQFRLVNKGGGHFQLSSASSSRCLDVDSGSMKPEATIFQWGCGDSANQQMLIKNRGSLAELQVRHSGMCLDAKTAGKEPGTPVIQWPCTGAPNQQFWIVSPGRPQAHR